MIKFIKIQMRGKLLGETIVIGIISVISILVYSFIFEEYLLGIVISFLSTIISFANIVSWDNNNHNLNKLLNSRLGSFIVFVILIFFGGAVYDLINCLDGSILAKIAFVFMILPCIWFFYVFTTGNKDFTDCTKI